jgi:hypothetical protein
MYLLLGHPHDSCCEGVRARLASRALETRIIASPLAPPASLKWRLDAGGVTSSLFPGLSDSAIDGVLVRDTGWLDPAGWEQEDLVYMQAELRAVMLAWLASLSCPVINRPDGSQWYRAGVPLVAWRRHLRGAGLRLPEVVIVSDPTEAAAFRLRLEVDGVGGAVYAPLTNASPYLLADTDAWGRLALVQTRTPVCLTEPHGASTLACVVGDDVIWNGAPPPETRILETALRRFAAATALAFVEVAIAPVRRGPAVVLVEPRPRLERFDEPARARILDSLVAVLTQARGVAGAPPPVLS